MKTFNELTIGDVFYCCLFHDVFPFFITEIDKSPRNGWVRFTGLTGSDMFKCTWSVPRNQIHSSVAFDCAVTFDLAKQQRLKLTYMENIKYKILYGKIKPNNQLQSK